MDHWKKILKLVTRLANYVNWSRAALYPLLHVIDCSSLSMPMLYVILWYSPDE